jgi:hypothetical protein
MKAEPKNGLSAKESAEATNASERRALLPAAC